MREIKFEDITFKLDKELEIERIRAVQGPVTVFDKTYEQLSIQLWCVNLVPNPMGNRCMAYINILDRGYDKTYYRFDMTISIDEYFWELKAYRFYHRYREWFTQFFLKLEDEFGISMPEMSYAI